MTRNLTAALIASFALLATAHLASAQVILMGPNGPMVIPAPPTQYIPPTAGQFPVYVTPNQVTGVNPITGGLDTTNQQIDNTTFQVGRNESMNNGTKRWVRRPVYNQAGQIVGYQEGYVWNNSITGQEHGNLVSYTPNNQGGVNEQHRSYSMENGNSSQQPNPTQGGVGVHKQIRSFSVDQ
ncbi:MAG: hypothetical protein R3E01_00990 [Pirellulaceae bacterium]|nr:hypothetical protein [Planctomycetales bacterium]